MPDQVTCKRHLWLSALPLSLSLTLALPSLILAADFKNSQRVYVSPSLYERRIEFNDDREKQAVAQNNADKSGAHHKITTAAGAGSKAGTQHPYGKLPPPPASSTSLAAASKELNERLQKAVSSPKVQAALKELKAQAENYARSGKMAEAKHAVAEALQLTPHDKTLLRELGTISVQRAKQFMQSTDLQSATQYARQALAFDAANPEAHKMLDGLLQKEGINPVDPLQRLKAADLLASRGHNDEAWVEYQAVNRLKPSAEAHVGMGNLALRAGDRERAKQEYLNAAELSPSSSLAHRQLGMLKMGAGDIVGANTELSRALVLDSHDQGASKALVELWQNQVSKVPGANSHLGLARAYQLSGNLQSAQAEYRNVVSIDPENPHLPAARQSFKLALSKQESEKAAEAAHTLEGQGALPEAYQKLEEAVRLDPNDSDLRVHEGYLLERMHSYTAARDAYMQALKINPHNLLAATNIKNLPAAATEQPVFIPQGSGGYRSAPGQAGTTDAITQAQNTSVNSLSNFAYALRNHMVMHKNATQDLEDQAHGALSQFGHGAPSESLVSAGTVGATSGAALAAGSSSLAAGGGGDALAGSVSSALANARAALASAHGGTPSAITAPAMPIGSAKTAVMPSGSSSPAAGWSASQSSAALNSTAAPTTASSAPSWASAFNNSPPPVSNAGAMPPLAPAPNYSTAAQMMPTFPLAQTANASALESAATALPSLAAATAPWTSGPSLSEPPLAPPIGGSASSYTPYGTMLPGALSTNNAPSLRGTMPTGKPMIPATTSGLSIANIKFELLNANPKIKDVELNVVLKNDGDTALLIPRTAHGVIKYSNRPDAAVKVVFNSSAVAPHSLTHGTIHIPYNQADPSADLILPGLLPADSGDRDLHLTTSVASR